MQTHFAGFFSVKSAFSPNQCISSWTMFSTTAIQHTAVGLTSSSGSDFIITCMRDLTKLLVFRAPTSPASPARTSSSGGSVARRRKRAQYRTCFTKWLTIPSQKLSTTTSCCLRKISGQCFGVWHAKPGRNRIAPPVDWLCKGQLLEVTVIVKYPAFLEVLLFHLKNKPTWLLASTVAMQIIIASV